MDFGYQPLADDLTSFNEKSKKTAFSICAFKYSA